MILFVNLLILIALALSGKGNDKYLFTDTKTDLNGNLTAHKSLPFGSYVQVRNPKNGKFVMVEIIDRGPFVKGRIIDLSKDAAEAIGLKGTGRVTIE